MQLDQNARGFGPHVFRTGQALLINEGMDDAVRRFGSYVISGSQSIEKSALFVPMVAGHVVRGLIALSDMEHEHAFGEADVRLLQTLAGSMAVALENARLFDETQRLLKETERRNAELAVINSIQQGVSAELDFQAIVELVGDKLREVFDTGDMMINWRDEARQVRQILYSCEHGVRNFLAPVPDPLDRPMDRIVLQRQPVVIRNRADGEALGLIHFAGTDMSLSSVVVPMFAGDRFLGTIVIESYARENAFGESEVRLLSTVAAGIGAALENARLFAETQRLLKETERRARESSALSEVGRDLSSSLDLSVVMDRIAHHAKDFLQAANSAIFLPDAATGTYRAMVAIGDAAEAIKATAVESGVGIIGSLLRSGEAELVNDIGADPRGVQVPGTERRSDERLMVVPLLAGTRVLGAMAVWRNGGAPFERQELEFLVGLSRQATVALQNARLFNETEEALERQTATSEVLQVISSSVEDAGPCSTRSSTAASAFRRRRGRRAPGRRGRPGPPGRPPRLGARGARRAAPAAARPMSSNACLSTSSTSSRTPGARRRTPMRSPSPSASATTRSDRADALGRPGIGSIYVIAPAAAGVRRQGASACCRFRRPGGDRDPERAPVPRGAGGARRRRGRQRGQERVPRDHEPRDPHADERRDRHERAAARHAARRRAARLRRHDPRLAATRC